MVQPGTPWVVGHVVARWERPDLTWEPTNWQPEHRACSDRSGQGEVIAKAKAEAVAEERERVRRLGSESESRSRFPDLERSEESPLLSGHTHEPSGAIEEPVTVREELSWASFVQDAPPWLSDLVEVPQDASPPLAMTPVPVDAVGSYGRAAVEWIESELGLTLRWWQKLAITRQLEHREDGSLCWRTILESGPRRIGKSVRLRGMALWRQSHADLFGEKQLTVHTGKDVAVVREIHRQAWAWATEREGWFVRKGVGQEEVVQGENRWLVRSVDSVYGYDVCQAMVDEAWGVMPQVVDDGLEPAMLERVSPQLTLTSTAHRRATALMRTRLSAALAAEDGETLLMLWGVLAGADVSNPEVWRSASPHWSADRERVVRAKYEKAMAGEADPELDDPDPLQGWASQYLNQWLLRTPRLKKGSPVISAEGWARLRAEVPDRAPDGVAVESWFAEGVSVATAWREGVVAVTGHADLVEAVEAVRASGFRGVVTVGASLCEDPALRTVRRAAGKGRTSSAVGELVRLLGEGGARHDGGAYLAEQVAGLRTVPGVDGARLVSTGRADGVKAAVWALQAARKRLRTSRRVLVPSS